MKPFEFVLVIISIIIGLSFTEFANAVGYMIKTYKTSTFSLPYLLTTLTGLTAGLNYWGSVYMHRKIKEWDNLKMGLLFLTALTYYTIARVFLPDPNSFNHNYVQLYHEVISTSLAMMICFLISLIIETYVLKKGRPLKWYLIMFSFILLMLSGVIIDNRTYREILSFILLALQLLNLIIVRTVISDNSNIRTKN